VNTLDWYFDAGFNFSGFIPGHLQDTAGVAVARSNFSQDFSDAQVNGGSNPFDAETVIEATYKMQISPWWTVQPDFQYIFTPGGEKGSSDAAIIGVRTTLAF
jgi:porin